MTFSDPQGDWIVSMRAAKAIMKKYNVQADGAGNYQIARWMVTEMLAWDEANGTGPGSAALKRQRRAALHRE